MTVDVHGHPNVRVAEDPLHSSRARPEHHEQRCGGVARVVETDRHDLADGPELHVAAGAAAERAVGRFDEIATALTSTFVRVPGHDLGAAKRRATPDVNIRYFVRYGGRSISGSV